MSSDEPMAVDLEARLTLALEAAPAVQVPKDFTARVMSNLPRRPAPAYLRPTHYGRNAMLICGLVLCVLLIISAFAMQHGSVAWVLAQGILFPQLAGIALWLSLCPQGRPQ